MHHPKGPQKPLGCFSFLQTPLKTAIPQTHPQTLEVAMRKGTKEFTI